MTRLACDESVCDATCLCTFGVRSTILLTILTCIHHVYTHMLTHTTCVHTCTCTCTHAHTQTHKHTNIFFLLFTCDVLVYLVSAIALYGINWEHKVKGVINFELTTSLFFLE